MPFQSSYLDATWRHVNPFFPKQRRRWGVCFEIAGAAPVRLALTRDDAKELIKSLQAYLKSSGDVVEWTVEEQVSIYTAIRLGATGEWFSRQSFSRPLNTNFTGMSSKHILAVEIPRVLAELSESMIADSALLSDGEA